MLRDNPVCQWGFLWWNIPQKVATFSSRVTLPSTNCPKVTFFPSRFCSDRGYSELSLSHIVQNLEHCIPDNKIGSTKAYMDAMLPHNFLNCICRSSYRQFYIYIRTFEGLFWVQIYALIVMLILWNCDNIFLYNIRGDE